MGASRTLHSWVSGCPGDYRPGSEDCVLLVETTGTRHNLGTHRGVVNAIRGTCGAGSNIPDPEPVRGLLRDAARSGGTLTSMSCRRAVCHGFLNEIRSRRGWQDSRFQWVSHPIRSWHGSCSNRPQRDAQLIPNQSKAFQVRTRVCGDTRVFRFLNQKISCFPSSILNLHLCHPST